MKKFIITTVLFAVCLFGLFAAEDYTVYIVPGDGEAREVQADFVTTSIDKALTQVASLENVKKVKIIMSQGTYYLEDGIVFSHKNLSAGVELDIDGSNSILFAGKRVGLDDFSKDSDGRVSFAYSGEFKGLFIDGKKYRQARYPNYDAAIKPYSGFASYKELVRRANQRRWKITEDVFFHALHGGRWGGYHFRIEKRSLTGFRLSGGHQNNRPEHPFSKKYSFVEGVFQELDTPGEFFYDRKGGRVYFFPYEGETPVGSGSYAEIITSDSIFKVVGEKDKPVKNITFKRLSFRGASATFMASMEPLLRSDWMIHRGAALFLENVENIVVDSCVFSELDGNAVFVSRHAKGVEIRSSIIEDVGGSGIAFVGDPKDVRMPLFNYYQRFTSQPDSQPGPLGDNHPVDCLVYDNIITNIGTIEKQSAGVQISMASRIKIKNNSIYYLPRAGINVSEGTWGGHIIEGNDVFDTVLETSDHGAFNSWGRDRFWDPDRAVTDRWVAVDRGLPFADVVEPIIIRNNRFQCDHGWDIDLDDGSSNYEIYNNLSLSGGIKLREGFKRIVTNNIIINNTFHPHVWYKENDSDLFKFNIVFSPYAPIALEGEGKEIDYNFFHNCEIDGQAFESWDRNSISGDAGFVNAREGDYRLKADSPAIALGFKPFDLDGFGVVSEDLRKVAKQPEMPKTEFGSRVVEGKIYSWGGLELKNIETLGEQSAAGLSECAGVLILGGSEHRLLELGLQKNDVILSLGRIETPTVEAFFSALEHYGVVLSRSAKISRNQSTLTVRLRLKVFKNLALPGNHW